MNVLAFQLGLPVVPVCISSLPLTSLLTESDYCPVV